MAKKPKRPVKKEFKRNGARLLNPPHSDDSGVMLWVVKAHSQKPWLEADLTIWDCSKKISLSFDSGEGTPLKDRLSKLDVIISELGKFKAALIQAAPVHAEGIAYVKQERKNEGRNTTLRLGQEILI